jgi:hypothetical protein
MGGGQYLFIFHKGAFMDTHKKLKTKLEIGFTVEHFNTFDEAKAAVVATAKAIREHIDPRLKIEYSINDDQDTWPNRERGEVLADGALAWHRQKRFVLSMINASALDDEVFEYDDDFDTYDEALAAALAKGKEMSEHGIVLVSELQYEISDLAEQDEERRKEEEAWADACATAYDTPQKS